MRNTAIAGILILGLIFLFHDSHDVTKSIQVEKLNTFISEEGIEDSKIVKISDSKYYLFSNDNHTIYVYEGNQHSRITKGIPRDGIVFGGLQQGSFGLIVKNEDILNNVHKYVLNIDGESVTYNYNKEKYLVVQDARIWNPNPEVTITFLNKQGKEILKENF